MEKDLRDSGKMDYFMARESRRCKMEQYLMATGKRAVQSVRGCANIQMEQNIPEAGSTVSLMALVSKYYLMGPSTQVIGLMVKLMVKE
jgi:hypothetical protein